MNRISFWRVLVVAGCAALSAGALRLSIDTVRAAAATARDWPQWRGPNRDAVAGTTGLKDSWEGGAPKLLWQANGLGLGFSSLAIAGERIYTLGDIGTDQFLIALDRANGKTLWKARVGPRWDDEFPGPRSTPTVDGDRVYALGSEGDLVCVDAASGAVRWAKNLEKQYSGRIMTVWKWSESPLVDEDRVVVTPGGPWAAMVALDKMTGKDIWTTKEMPHLGEKGRDGAAYSSIVISNGAGVKQYVQLMGRGLVGIRAKDGQFLWGYNRVVNHVANISTPLVWGDHVFASTGYQTGAALVKLEKDGEGVKAREVYFLEPRVFQNHHGGMVLVNGYVYAGHGHNNGFPICIEAATGKVAWGGEIRGPGSNSAAVVYADGDLYFRYQNGLMALIEANPGAYKLKGSFPIPQPGAAKPSWSHPVVLDGKLYLREQDQLLVYDIKA